MNPAVEMLEDVLAEGTMLHGMHPRPDHVRLERAGAAGPEREPQV